MYLVPKTSTGRTISGVNKVNSSIKGVIISMIVYIKEEQIQKIYKLQQKSD